MIITVLLWGAVAGLVHFVVIGFLYGNPLTERISAGAEAESPAVRALLKAAMAERRMRLSK